MVENSVQAIGITAPWRGLWNKTPFKNVGEIHKDWTAAGVSASRTTMHRRMQDMGFSCRIPCVKPLLNKRQRQKRLAWAKDKKDWTAAEWSKSYFLWWKSILHFLWKSRSQSLDEESRGKESTLLEVQCKVSTVSDGLGAMSSAGVGPLCFLRSRVNAAIYQEVLEHFLLLTNFMEMQISFSNRTWHLHTVPKLPVPGLRTMVSPVLNWPANSPDLSP